MCSLVTQITWRSRCTDIAVKYGTWMKIRKEYLCVLDFCLTVHHQLGKVIQMNQLDATMIYWSIRSALNMFRAIFCPSSGAISWNSCYVYVCFCVLNMFETIEGAADCEIPSVIRFFWKPGMCYQVRFITRPFKCMVTMWWVMAWLENGFGCSMKDERTCTMRRKVGVHLWFKQTISTRKIMCTVFWDRQGVLLVQFLPHAQQ